MFYVVGSVILCFVENLFSRLAVKEFRKSLMIWQNCRRNRIALFWDTSY